MKITAQIAKKKFSDENSKQAYLKACKWLAKNVYSKVELSKRIAVQIDKDAEEQLPTFVVTLLYAVEEKGMREEQCARCKRAHTIFYSHDKVRCDKCEFSAFHSTVLKESDSIKNLYKEVFDNE